MHAEVERVFNSTTAFSDASSVGKVGKVSEL